MNEQLKGKKVMVLGGSTGIGLAVAKAAAADGAQATIVSSNQHRIDNALKELPEGSIGYVADLADEQLVKELFRKAGNIDHLVYTAGENIQMGNAADINIADARGFFQVRYWGAFAAVKYASPFINTGGSITLTGGIAGTRPGKGWGVAASICMAMEGFTRAMAVELAPVRVNLVAPGVVRTNLWDSLSDADREGLYSSMADALLVKRVGEAEDIAQTYLYLMKQQYGTGQCVVTDGGGVLV